MVAKPSYETIIEVDNIGERKASTFSGFNSGVML